MQPKILCIGDMTPDILIPYGHTKEAKRLLREGKELLRSNPVLRPGGAVSNTVATLGKLGLSPYMLGGVDAYEYGDFIIQYLQGVGVHTEYIYRQAERMSLILAVLDGDERELYLFDGPGAKLPMPKAEHLPAELPKMMDWVHSNGFANDCVVDYLATCKQAGTIVSFDLNLRCETFGLDEARKARILRAVDACDYLLGSGAEEFVPLTGIPDFEQAAQSLATAGRTVIARDGANPVHIFENELHQIVPTIPTRVVNSVGGGDAGNGGFIAAKALGKSTYEAVVWGNLCAAAAIASHEPHAVPIRKEVERMAKAYLV